MQNHPRKNEEYRSENGGLIYQKRFSVLLAYFDNEVSRIAKHYFAKEFSFPSLIASETLRKLDYMSSFPELLSFVVPYGDLKQKRYSPNVALTPATCYHAYALLEHKSLPAVPYVISAKSKCYRYEGERLSKTPERLWEFTMREIIFWGKSEDVLMIRNDIMNKTKKVLARVGLEGNFEEATDPFFLGESRGKLLIQRMKKLKYELKASLPRGLALASFNHHEAFFSKKMHISVSRGKMSDSGCAAFGLERWAYAFLCKWGENPTKWPTPVQNYLRKYEISK